MRLRRFSVNAVYIPGKDLILADALSRSPLPLGNGSDNQDEDDDVQQFLNMIDSSRPASEEKILQIEEATREDHVLQEVIKLVLNGWPRYQTQVPVEVRRFFAYRAELSYSEGKLPYRNQIVIPAALKKEVVQRVHDGHLG